MTAETPTSPELRAQEVLRTLPEHAFADRAYVAGMFLTGLANAICEELANAGVMSFEQAEASMRAAFESPIW